MGQRLPRENEAQGLGGQPSPNWAAVAQKRRGSRFRWATAAQNGRKRVPVGQRLPGESWPCGAESGRSGKRWSAEDQKGRGSAL
jgi:hypothetical protein